MQKHAMDGSSPTVRRAAAGFWSKPKWMVYIRGVGMLERTQHHVLDGGLGLNLSLTSPVLLCLVLECSRASTRAARCSGGLGVSPLCRLDSRACEVVFMQYAMRF